MPPLLYIIFNRPEKTRRTFELIRQARPSVLYVAADAPRQDRPDEAKRCEETRQITNSVDWPCEVRRLYASKNMGCGHRISSAITEVLKDHQQVMILEDDCVAEPSFFDFCGELLDRYQDDDRVMAVSGNNHQRGQKRSDSSYYFSKYPHCWGWGTWRRAWNHFDLKIPFWPSVRDSGELWNFCDTQREVDFWTEMYDGVHGGTIDSWALPWTLCCWLQNGMTILPQHNLVSNIGFDADGTHTTSNSPFANLPTEPIGKLAHPADVFAHRVADRATDDFLYSGPWDFGRRRKKKWFSSKKLKQRFRNAA